MSAYFIAFLVLITTCTYAGTQQTERFPANIQYKVQPFYRFRTDGKPGREVIIKFGGAKLFAASTLEVRADKVREKIVLEGGTHGVDSVMILLPADVGVNKEAQVELTLRQDRHKLDKTIRVPALRHWTVYVYPHSHVDIGYSNTQENVEFIHRRNIDQGIRLAEKTKTYPEGARYLWNTEVMWPFERTMQKATDQKKKQLTDAVKQGQLCLDASYVHVNTSTCSEEELFQLFRSRREAVNQTGMPVDVMVQVDIPGMAWGVVPVLAHEGIRSVMMMPNGTRGNQKMTYAINQQPFWWIGPDGKSKVLFFQPGSYGVGLAKGLTTGRPWFGQLDTTKIPKVVKTDNPRANFLDNHLFTTLPAMELSHHPYDFYVVTWAMWDNALQDADLPDAVASWNKEYAFPHLEIASAHQIMQTIEKRYGNILPTIKGDYTEYWTDNMGVAARENKLNQNAKERMLQAETVWSMINSGRPAPRAEFDEAWRYIILGSEHTYATENPKDPLLFNATWKGKQHYFREADARSVTLLDKALAAATDRSAGALGPVEGPSNGGVAVLNTHSWNHGGLVTLNPLESQKGDRVIDDHGKEVPAQRLTTGDLVFFAEDVPSFGARHYRVTPGKCLLTGSCSFEGNKLKNGSIEVEIDPVSGNIIGLVEKVSGHNFADAGKGLNTFTWQPGKGLGVARPDSVIAISVKEMGPLVVEVQVTSQAPGCKSLSRTIRLIDKQPWAEVSNTVDKLPLEDKDGIHFGYHFNIPQGITRIDIPWGIMRVEDDQWPAANRAWMASQHWVDISNNGQGVTWCSLDAPLIESGSITANNTAGWDGAGDIWPSKLAQSSTIFSWVMNNHWYTNTPLTQEGPVAFRYRLMPHGGYDASVANRFGLSQAQPLVHVLCDKNPIGKPLVSIDNNRVFINVLKPMADGKSTILRLRSLSDKDEPVTFTWPSRKPTAVYLCEKGEEVDSTLTGNGIQVPAMGLITLRAEW